MTEAEREWSLIEGLEYCKNKRRYDKSCAKCPYAGLGCAIDAAIVKLKAQELRYTPREVRNVLMEYGQHDLNIGLGEVIKYDPVQVEGILIKAREAIKPVIPHMVDWGIYECPKCKTRVDKTYKYCKHCGMAVEWDDDDVLS